jgi:5-methylcytosine-specific restriction endonuclease McrA
MSRKVLILNQDYSAMGICSAAKAFLLVYLDKAELVASSSIYNLRTVSSAYPMPTVIRLNRYVTIPYKGIVMTRQNIFKRDGHRCVYCNTTEDLTLDHVHPKSRGGRTSWDNLVTACRRCNAKKGDYTLEDAGLKISHKPFKPSFVMFLRDYSGSAEESWLPYLAKREKNF